MKEIKSFSQGQLIRQTGDIYPSGICLGLVTYWLIACHRHEESQFWADIEHSISPPRNQPISKAPLIYGEGYAAKASVFHEQNGMADVIVRSRQAMVIEGKMKMLHNETVPVNFFQNNFMDYAISKILQKDVTYTILSIFGAESNGHAIGIHNEKGKVHLFDPNFFVLECDSKTDLTGELKEAFLTIDNGYQARFNKKFSLDAFY
ncbi:YopT-type cysteine protease domain-containing protein [Akkermansia massiliensis]|uniref:YopT-type cysteine protease domain-containing protein n=1 Tax=Akkermansia massiliensis TaxID=2927224 RepID=UPI00202F942A|nr:YopT-type cysteine protease domain-containing protein [Akkermansia sp. B2-R-115]MCM0684973.1 YopT-type cysteine protease domain-containing protein [Akkermansia sp. B2-R-115]